MNSIHRGLFSLLFGLPRAPRRVSRRVVKKKVSRKKRTPIRAIDREAARVLVHARLEHFNQHYGFSYNKVAIRNQSTRWGSCSNRGNLNFNVRILTLSPEAQDYLVIHELCHLKEFNHSQRFWDLVAEQCPDYRRIRTLLQTASATDAEKMVY